MAEEWYVARGKSKEGPFPLDQMKRLASQGQLLPTDMILMAGAQKWAAASTVEGLFDAQAKAPVASSLQENPVAWVQEQFRTNPQRVLLAGGGAALVLLFVVCVGCVGFVSLMSGGGSGSHGGSQARAKVRAFEKVLDKCLDGANPDEVDALWKDYRNIPFDAKGNPEEAQEIVDLYQNKVERRGRRLSGVIGMQIVNEVENVAMDLRTREANN